MSKLDNKIQELFAKLPDDYQEAVSNIQVHEAIDDIGEQYSLDEEVLVRLDREVTYLILGLQDTPGFMLRLEEKAGLEEDKVADITESVTKKIIEPLQQEVESLTADSDDSMPVPPPPPENPEMPESSGYGGASDPYREPVDDES